MSKRSSPEKMTQYILFIHRDTESEPTSDEWESFFQSAAQSGMFRGGSAIGEREEIGDAQVAKPSDHIAGFMRFDSEDKQAVLDLLESHPVVIHGGCVELCVMSES